MNDDNQMNAQQQSPDDFKLKCPRCGSENVEIIREQAGSQRKGKGHGAGTSVAGIGFGSGKTKSKTKINYQTTCICKNCGYTFDSGQKGSKGNVTVGKVLLWICFFPIMLSIWLWKTDKIKNKAVKIVLIAALWAIVIVIGVTSPNDSTQSSSTTTTPAVQTTESATVSETTESEETTVAFNKDAYDLPVTVSSVSQYDVISVTGNSENDLKDMKTVVSDALKAYKGEEYAKKHEDEIISYIDDNFGKEVRKEFDKKSVAVILSAPNEDEKEYRIDLYVYK